MIKILFDNKIKQPDTALKERLNRVMVVKGVRTNSVKLFFKLLRFFTIKFLNADNIIYESFRKKPSSGL